MDYFRAMVLADERSARALTVTTAVIERSAANYTAWQFRRAVLHAIAPPDKPESEQRWSDELQFVTDVAREHPKNYQVWYHRRCVVDVLALSPQRWSREALLNIERDATATVLSQDGKNYHAWSHRQWALQHFDGWADELAYVDGEIIKDVRNHSAWSARHTVLRRLHGDPLPDAQWTAELQYAMQAITRAPSNESSWSYARGLYRSSSNAYTHMRRPDLERWCVAQRSQWPACSHLLATLCDVADEALRSSDEVWPRTERILRVERAIEASEALAGGVDDVHAKFWRRRAHRFRVSLSSMR